MNTFLDYAPSVGMACLLINSAIAVIYFFKHRRQRQRALRAEARNAALSVDNLGLRAQNARLVQRLARLLTGVGNAARTIEDFNPTKENNT